VKMTQPMVAKMTTRKRMKKKRPHLQVELG
jgi:hypothetical protein